MMGSHAIDESDVPSGRERGGRSCSALATRMEKSFACLLPAIDRRGRTTDGRQACEELARMRDKGGNHG